MGVEERGRSPRRDRSTSRAANRTDADAEEADETGSGPGDPIDWRAPHGLRWVEWAHEMVDQERRVRRSVGESQIGQEDQRGYFDEQDGQSYLPDGDALFGPELPACAGDERDNEPDMQPDQQHAEAEIPAHRPVPEQPTQSELVHHRVTHLPYREWCTDCVC